MKLEGKNLTTVFIAILKTASIREIGKWIEIKQHFKAANVLKYYTPLLKVFVKT